MSRSIHSTRNEFGREKRFRYTAQEAQDDRHMRVRNIADRAFSFDFRFRPAHTGS
jgi:hypothetical protein